MLENLVKDQYTGIYNVSISHEFHGTPAYLADAGSISLASTMKRNPPTPKLLESYF